jgi:hypothetical protein
MNTHFHELFIKISVNSRNERTFFSILSSSRLLNQRFPSRELLRRQSLLFVPIRVGLRLKFLYVYPRQWGCLETSVSEQLPLKTAVLQGFSEHLFAPPGVFQDTAFFFLLQL